MIGTTLASFEIKSKLGEGGMGEVWLAEDTKLGREVAIKVLPADIGTRSEDLGKTPAPCSSWVDMRPSPPSTFLSFRQDDTQPSVQIVDRLPET